MTEPIYGRAHTEQAHAPLNAAPGADDQRAELRSQQRFLRERLKSIPPTAQLTRNSIIDRIEVLDEELARLDEASPSWPNQAARPAAAK